MREVICIIVVIGKSVCFSQSFYLKVVPRISTMFGTFQQFSNSSPQSKINLLPISSIGNIAWTSVNYNLGINFFQYRNFDFGFQIGTINSVVGYRINYSPKFETTEGTFQSAQFQNTVTIKSARIDYGFTISYHLTGKESDKRLEQSLVLEPTFSTNISTAAGDSWQSYNLSDGTIDIHESEKMQQRLMAFAIGFNYNVVFHSKNKKVLFGCNVGYRQGFNSVSRYEFEVSHSNGMKIDIHSFSKTSGIFICISKPINLIKPKNS